MRECDLSLAGVKAYAAASVLGQFQTPHRIRSVSKPYQSRTKSKRMDTEMIRRWYGSGAEKVGKTDQKNSFFISPAYVSEGFSVIDKV
ncbi:MAG: hypothetical protein EGQ20_15365 [Bacteroides oleiciplenus]|nr:hypothetical protein [Bacteroides oleiciplenus]